MKYRDLFRKTTPANVYAFIMFWLAKGCAFAGVAVGFMPSLWTLGAVLLAFAFILLTASVVTCVREMNRQNAVEEAWKKAEAEKLDLFRQMIEDGTLFRQMQKAGYKITPKNEMSEMIHWN